MRTQLSVVEICAGAGGQSYGLEQAGYAHTLAVEIDADAASTLRANRPMWRVYEGDVRNVNGSDYTGIDLLAGGVPCPPFSVAGKQLGSEDERDLFPEALRLVREMRPQAVMLENVKGLASARFSTYRESILTELETLGYQVDWRLVLSSRLGVPQLRPRFVLIALRNRVHFARFEWPEPVVAHQSVGETLYPLMAENGWRGARMWAHRATGIAPTIVGGSKKHGGADLGPTRARAAWAKLGVNGTSVANEAPSVEDPGDMVPRLTNRMVARIQGFDDAWVFVGKKTSVYRQIGNAFPPPVAAHVATSLARALGARVPKYSDQVQSEQLKAVV